MIDQMYQQTEKQATVAALKGPQFVRNRHGSLYDRGSADSYYRRPPQPHYGGVGGDSGERVYVQDADSVKEYMAGYNYNEACGCFKDYD